MAKRASPPDAQMLDTREVAAYLRLKERRIYDLVRQHAIPYVRATGKLLFPRAQIDAWLASKSTSAQDSVVSARPPIIAGSHDPLLEWAARESGCGLAILACGSREGVQRLARGDATAAAAHWRDEASGEFNLALVREAMPDSDVVMLEWARRRQGLLLAPGNPRRIRKLADLARSGVRVARRQPGAGSYRLLEQLLQEARVPLARLQWTAGHAHGETELATAIVEGRADAGFGIEAAARAHGLAFIPLASERLDLVAHRRDVFEPALQALLAFARTPTFMTRAKALGGYDVSAVGRVVFNG
ncbi:MAG TPA: helix-turn-helix transcriptional regulator [Casimicrobiaceae bacterium]|jgi:excisionase family DNA binding protein